MKGQELSQRESLEGAFQRCWVIVVHYRDSGLWFPILFRPRSIFGRL